MSLSKDIESPQNSKKLGPAMSYRQQIRYVLEKSLEENIGSHMLVPEIQLHELEEYLQDEDMRKALPSLSKQEFRYKMTEDASKVYKPIRKTIFLERKHSKLAANEIMVCSCKEPVELTSGPYAGLFTIGCGKKCLNRVMSTECSAIMCPTGERCTNRRFQLQQHVQVYPIRTEGRGWGLSAGQNIRKGQFVIQYLGEVYSIDSDIGVARMEKYKANPCTYLMSTSHNEVIDPARKGNMARFINHSCDPNCETQKWNVLGEVCVGIFAKKNITEDEELTFDYRLDTHKTTLTRCLCGSHNCRQYLGLIPTKYSNADDWIRRLDTMKCTTCKKTSGADDECLILCDICNRGWHIYCLKNPLKTVPTGTWVCQKCNNRAIRRGEKPKRERNEPEEIKINLEKRQFDTLKKHLDEILEMDVKLFWENLASEGLTEVTIRGINAKKVEKYIQEISKKIVCVNQVEDEVTELELKFESIYLKNVLDYYSKKSIGIHLTYSEEVSVEGVYPLDTLTSIILTGRRQDIYKIADMIFDFIDSLVVFTLLISHTEYRMIEANFLNFKNLIFPVEVRLSQEKNVNESPHPFFFYSREERKLIFIGNELEVNEAYKFSIAWLINQFSGETDTCYHFILPTRVSIIVKKVKLEIISSLKLMHSLITPVIKYFDPILPRKYLTVLLIGSWKQILTGKAKLLNEIKRLSGYEEMEQFFSFVSAQMYRHIFKNSAKFIHALEKWLISSYNQNESKKLYILKFWDVYSPEVTSPSRPGEPINEFRIKVMGHLNLDTDTMLNLIRLCDSEAQVQYLLQGQFKISVEETLRKSCLFYGNFCKEFEGRGKLEYFNFYLQGISNHLIDNGEDEDLLEEDHSKMLEKIIEEVRQVNNNKKFTVFPMSYGTDIDLSTWNPSPDSKISAYLHNLEYRTFILGSENHVNQVIGAAQVLPEVKESADIMIGCDKNPNNFLYVLFADKPEANQRFI